jgi:hypothetical protein
VAETVSELMGVGGQRSVCMRVLAVVVSILCLTPLPGDEHVQILAMWLRDSQNQVQPYLSFLGTDANATALVRGVLRRQAYFINVDPFANAFQLPGSMPSPHSSGANPDSSSYIGYGDVCV